MIRGIISRRKDVVRSQGRGQSLLDAGSEYIAIDPSPWSLGPVRFHGSTSMTQGAVTFVMAQGGDEGHGIPMSEGGLSDQPLAARRPSPEWGHVGLGRSPLGLNQWRLQWLTFVDKDQSFQVNPALMRLPALALAGHVGPVLFTGQSGFF